MGSQPDATPPSPRRARKRGDGEGSIYKRTTRRIRKRDGVEITSTLWVGELLVGRRLDGRWDVRRVTAKTRAEVQAKLDKLRSQLAGQIIADVDTERLTLAGFLARFLDGQRGRLRPRTHERYSSIVRLHIAPSLGSKKLRDLRPDHLRRFYAQLAEHGLAPRTVYKVHALLHRALKEALEDGAIVRNVADVVHGPALDKHEITLPTMAEAGHFLDLAWESNDRLAGLWTLAVYSGCRQGELLGLRWTDINTAERTLTVQRTLVRVRNGEPTTGEPKTKNSRRTVILPQIALDALSKWRARQLEDRLAAGPTYADTGFVFTTEGGTALPARNVVRCFKHALEVAGLPNSVRFHDLRHLAATIMLAAGVHPKVASERLGHSTVQITLDLYSHVVAGLDADAADRMERAMQNARHR